MRFLLIVLSLLPALVSAGLAIHQFQWSSHLWPNGVVPYSIASHYNPTERAVILSAMDAFYNVTCIRFRPRTSADKHFLQINKYYNLERCFSFIGRQTSRFLFGTADGSVETRMKLDPSCLRYNGRGTVIHELMHILGFYHEHQRDDRDPRIGAYAQHYNFKIYPRSRSLYMGAYDANSIMHYNFRNVPWQSRAYFSPADIRNINQLYHCDARRYSSQQTTSSEDTTSSTTRSGNEVESNQITRRARF